MMLDPYLLTRLNQKKGQLDLLRPLPQNLVRRLNKQLAVEWIYNSNAIEGNRLTLRETRLILERGLTIGGKTLHEHLEVINHEKAIEYLHTLIAHDIPLTAFHVRQIHDLLLQKIDDENAGEYRKLSVRITGASHTPPDSSEVARLMKKWGDWLNGVAATLHPVERAALAHHRLMAIHPFLNGNGPTARLVMNFLLMREGYPPTVIMKVNRGQYYRVLAQTDRGHNSPLVNFVGRAIERSLTLYLEAPHTQRPSGEEEEILLREAEKYVPYSQQYLSLLARAGRLEAVKRGGKWYTTRKALNQYRQSVNKSEV